MIVQLHIILVLPDLGISVFNFGYQTLNRRQSNQFVQRRALDLKSLSHENSKRNCLSLAFRRFRKI